MGLNWFMPALAKRRVGSLRGAQAEDGTLVWSLSSKYWTNVDRTLSVVHSMSSVVVVVVVSSLLVENRDRDRAAGLNVCLAPTLVDGGGGDGAVAIPCTRLMLVRRTKEEGWVRW